ncbi:MAG: glycosyltransferase, partial [Acidobacteria bacterium]|nr:glycosyltransferase [Acidobacteriota bacterium]
MSDGAAASKHPVWLVVPTYCEVRNLPELLTRIRALHIPIEILIVDDNSPDGTGRVADRIARSATGIHVLHRQTKDGLGRALVAGFAYAMDKGATTVATMDSDLSHRPEELPQLLLAAEDADF